MSRLSRLFSVFIAALALFGLASCLSMTLQGRISVKGNEPHTYLALSTGESEYSLVGPLRDSLLKQYQGKYLKVRGEIVKEALGPGYPAEFEVQDIVEVSSEPF